MTREDIADTDMPGALLRVKAECHLRGQGGVPKDHRMAKELMQEAASYGNEIALHMLASIKLFWSDDPTEQQQGFEQLLAEYKDGSAYAAGKIGYAYHQGLVVETDDSKALEYYEIAAAGGMTRWQLLLSRIYEEGLYGVEPDQERAEYWRGYWPKVHVETYECVLAASYTDGLAFAKDEKLAAFFADKCEGKGTSGWDRWQQDRDAWLESQRRSKSE